MLKAAISGEDYNSIRFNYEFPEAKVEWQALVENQLSPAGNEPTTFQSFGVRANHYFTTTVV